MTYLLAIACVIGIAIGQLLFKFGATTLKNSGSVFDPKTFMILSFALGLYGFVTILWIYVLQRLELGKVYPLMALAFVLVPIGSYFLFGEKFQTQYFVGLFLVVSGIIVIAKA
ncbi:EamA family transporter [Achromobacter sp.]|uniref:EamA family transporter n=1 Tax=Achromobacter sp. TaxID=134375 RepID=UPI0028A6BE56|nr:EamA family transporter [Achromobacter sp.]